MPRLLPLILLCAVVTGAVNRLEAADQVRLPADPAAFHLFLLMGQSNMEGQGRPFPAPYAQPNPRVLVLGRDGTWRQAQGATGGGAGIGPGDAFARAYADLHPGVTVGILNGARGGRALKELVKGAKDRDGDPVYDRVMAQAREAGKVGTFKALLWHQGEADAENRQYLAELAALVTDVRNDLGAKRLPFIAGELGEFAPWTGAFNNAIQALPGSIEGSALASSRLLGHVGDSVHFSGEAADLFGKRYLLAYARLVEPALVQPVQALVDAATAGAALAKESGALVNGTMEAGEGQPTGWTQAWTENGALRTSRDVAMFHGGKASLRIDTGGQRADGNVSQVLVPDRTAGRRLLISGWIRCEGAFEHVAACVTARGKEGKKLFWTTLLDAKDHPGEWMRFAAETAFPAEAVRPSVCILVNGSGTVWVDDVEALEVPGSAPVSGQPAAQGAAAPRLVNGAMEDGADCPQGWEALYVASGVLASARDTAKPFRGAACLRVATGPAGGDGNASQAIPGAAVAGRTFRVRGAVRAEGDGLKYAALCVSAWDSSRKMLFWRTVADAAQQQGGWREGSAEIVFPADTARAIVCLLITGTGTGWLDEVELTEVR